MLAVLFQVIAVDAFMIEPTWVEVGRVEMASDKITRKIRIVIVADLQTDAIGNHERRTLKRVMDERPDLILLAGDYVQVDDSDRRRQLCEQLRDYLQEIDFTAPLGIYAVRGNTDSDGWTEFFSGLPVTTFEQTGAVEVGELKISGLSMRDSFSGALRIERSDRFHIVLGHYPNFALSDVRADLLVAGHTHGGQVQLPLLGPIVTFSRVPRKWAAGVTDLGDGRTLIVSRGIGMERRDAPRLRFLCRPELVVVQLRPRR